MATEKDAHGVNSYINEGVESQGAERPGDAITGPLSSYVPEVHLDTPLLSNRMESRLDKLKNVSWILPLLHSEFWISAVFALIQPFFPVLVSLLIIHIGLLDAIA